MIVGVPKEIKPNEKRVGLVTAGVSELTRRGHQVLIETGAGQGIGLADEQYIAAGAKIVPDAAAVFGEAEMVVKVKEPQPIECKMLRPGQTLFTYLHLAPDPVQAEGLLASGCIAIAYETVTAPTGGLPLLAPMSEVAGRMAIQVGAYFLQNAQGGAGVLLGGVPGIVPGKVAILGGGVAGSHALAMAVGLGAEVVVIDNNLVRLRELDALYRGRVKTAFSTREAIEQHVTEADLVVGTVLIPGASAPKLITKDLLKEMKPGSVIVDVAVDQGGCTETTRPTTHADPVYLVDGIVHYCVANMPGGVARTSTYALNNATLPFTLALADKGPHQAMLDDPHLLAGLNVAYGHITYDPVGEALGLAVVPAEKALTQGADSGHQ